MEGFDGIIIGVILGLTELAKREGLGSRWLPLLALCLGLLGTWFLVPQETPAQTILKGLILGLTPMGLYSGTKATLGK